MILRTVVLTIAGASIAITSSCGEPPASPRAASSFPAPSSPAAPKTSAGTIAYEIAFEESRQELAITASIPAGVTQNVDIEQGASSYVSNATVESSGKTRPIVHGEDGYPLPECASSACVLRYVFRLKSACDGMDDTDSATEVSGSYEITPPTFLIAPWGSAASTRLRFHVQTPAPWMFVSGVYPATDGAADTYDISLADFGSAPYSLFGKVHTRKLALPGPPGSSAPSELVIAFVPNALSLSDEVLAAWIDKSARAVAKYYDGMPLAREALLVLPSRGSGVGFGKSLAGGGASVFVRVGRGATQRDLDEDWVLVHELTHAAFPAQPRSLDWVEEGLATYVEPLARARAGQLSAESVWRGMLNGLENGVPEAGDQGIDRTRTWGRVYWGGALFFFLADLEIRRRTAGKFTLREALVAILRKAGDNTARLPLDQALAVGDRATGTNVLVSQHAAWSQTPVPVPLDAIYKNLGVSLSNGRVVFDDSAPEAALRKSLTAPAP